MKKLGEYLRHMTYSPTLRKLGDLTLGVSLSLLWSLEAFLESPGALLAASWSLLGHSWRPLGASLGALGGGLGPLGRLLGRLGSDQNITKTTCQKKVNFQTRKGWIDPKVWGGFGRPKSTKIVPKTSPN